MQERFEPGEKGKPVEPSNKTIYLYLLFSTLFETYTVGDRGKIIDLLDDVSVLHKLADYNNLPSKLTSILSGRDKSYGLYGIFAQSDHESSFLVSDITLHSFVQRKNHIGSTGTCIYELIYVQNHVAVFALNVEFRESTLLEPPFIGPPQNRCAQDSDRCFGCSICGKNFDSLDALR